MRQAMRLRSVNLRGQLLAALPVVFVFHELLQCEQQRQREQQQRDEHEQRVLRILHNEK